MYFKCTHMKAAVVMQYAEIGVRIGVTMMFMCRVERDATSCGVI